MSEWLSEQWVVESAPAIELGEQFEGVVQVTVTGGPGGEVRYHRTYQGGRPVAGGLGPVGDPEVALTLPMAEASDMLDGRLAPSVAFMQGRLKTAGESGRLLEFLKGWASPAGTASLERMRKAVER